MRQPAARTTIVLIDEAREARRHPRVGVALLIGLFTAVSGCARETAGCGPAASRTLRVAVPNARAPGVDARDVMPPTTLTELPLIMLDDRGVPMPGLARSWTTQDRQTWTLTLRDDLRTHAGLPLTAARVREALLKEAARRAGFDPVARDLVRIDVTGETTLIVHLRRPSSAFAESLSSGLAPELSAGPFRLLRRSEARMDFAAFPATDTPANGLSGLTVTIYPSARAAWAAFLRDEADFLYDVPPSGASLLARNPDVQLYSVGGRQTYTLGFNVTHPRLRDARVRQAINYAIDREEIARTVLGGFARPSQGPFSPYHWAVQGMVPDWRYDRSPPSTCCTTRPAGARSRSNWSASRPRTIRWSPRSSRRSKCSSRASPSRCGWCRWTRPRSSGASRRATTMWSPRRSRWGEAICGPTSTGTAGTRGRSSGPATSRPTRRWMRSTRPPLPKRNGARPATWSR